MTGKIKGAEEMSELKRPGGPLARRPLHFIWIADCSGSMSGEKISILNQAIRTTIPHMREVASNNPHAEVLVRAVAFSDGARWETTKPTEIETFEWQDLQAYGHTDMGKAFQLVAGQLSIPPMSERALPPVLVLLSDGQPTDDYDYGLQQLLMLPWGKKAVRLAIAIGRDAEKGPLQKFIGNPEIKPLEALNAEALITYIHWASTAVLKAASSPDSSPQFAAGGGNVVLPPAPAVDTNAVW